MAVFLVSAVFAQSDLSAPKQEKLLNGLKVLMWPEAKAEKVVVKLRIHSGAAFDPQGKEGVMQMLSDNLFPNESAREFFKEDLGGDLEVITTYDYVQINASSKPESFMMMLETVATAVLNPVIDKETTAKIRAALLVKVAALEADPAYVADQAVAKRLFGTFPYGRPVHGTSDSLKKIDFPDLLDARNRFWTADNATITLAGNFDKGLALRGLRSRYFGSWQKADKKVPATFRQPDEPDTKELRIEMAGLNKTYSRWAKFAPPRNEKGYYPTVLFSWIRLEQRCKDTARFQANLLRGWFMYQEDKDIKDAASLDETLRAWPVTGGPCPLGRAPSLITRSNFDTAKSNLLRSVRNVLSTPSGIADHWLDVDTYKLTSAEGDVRNLAAVSLADVQAVAREFADARAVKVIVLPPAKPPVP